jgi:hypothetical protein
VGDGCTSDGDCCAQTYCSSGTCVACVSGGNPCIFDLDCCSGFCAGGACTG